MADGSVLMNTLICGIYRVSDIYTNEPGIESALKYQDLFGCSVPAILGHFQVLPAMLSEAILVLDISDPTDIKGVSRFHTPGYQLHWAGSDPGGSRLVVTSSGRVSTCSILMFDVDPVNAQLRPHESFGSSEFPRAGASFYRESWLHGEPDTIVDAGQPILMQRCSGTGRAYLAYIHVFTRRITIAWK